MCTRLLMFMSNESGATAVEYALMGSLLALALVIVVTGLGMRLSTEVSEVSGVVR
jgi:pilus assembly protein Flp/PilA